jgi:hypothetical protein
MRKSLTLFFVVLLGIIFTFASLSVSGGKAQGIKCLHSTVKALDVKSSAVVKGDPDFGNIPLYFIPNQGQVDEKARFYARTPRYTLWMTKEGLVFDSVRKDERDVSRIVFPAAGKNPEIVPVGITQHKVNYYKGKDSSKWQENISTSKAVLYKQLYKNIDLKVYGIEREIEYDWIVKPGGNPGDIRFQYKTVKGTHLDNDGNLVIETKFGELMHKKPVSFQVVEGEKVSVPSEFKEVGKDTYGFKVEKYNRNYELIIDPVVTLEYSTYLGGNNNDTGNGIAIDELGYIYITGFTYSADFPRLNASQRNIASSIDAFVTRFNPSGANLFFSTYFGGSDRDWGEDIVVFQDRFIYVIGTTYSSDLGFAVHQGGRNDVFVVKFNRKGELMAGCYLGGPDRDVGSAIALDNSGNVFITGYTYSRRFPTENAYQSQKRGGYDAFVCKLEPGELQIEYSTFLGGMDCDYARDIAVDNSGYFYVTGNTFSNGTGKKGFPLVNAFQSVNEGRCEVFLCKFKPDGSSLVFSSFLGGSSKDFGTSIAVGNSETVYVSGWTRSDDFDTTNNAQQTVYQGKGDAFVSKFKFENNIMNLEYSTYLGGKKEEYFTYLAVDNSGDIYMAGSTGSWDFPTREPFQNQKYPGSTDIFFSIIQPDNSSGDSDLQYSTFIGGSDYDYCNAMAMDSTGNVCLTGEIYSANFPTDNPYWISLRGLKDVFVSRFSVSNSITISAIANNTVPITITPVDNNGNGDGDTTFTRTYRKGTLVTLTAPEEYNDKSFIKWIVDGVDHLERSIRLTIEGDHSLSVVYQTPQTLGTISVNRSGLSFGVSTSGAATGAQDILIGKDGTGDIDWSVIDDADWLDCSPSTGTNSGRVEVSVNAAGLSAGTYTGTLTVSAPNASNSPQTVDVTLVVYDANTTAVPFGSFETPAEGSVVSGSVPVTGWVLDDIEVESVKIYREESSNLVYIGDAVLVEGARPDVENAYPNYPKCSSAGWGYMMISNFLPNGGNGDFTLHVIAVDKEGHQTTLGTTTITCDNANAVNPFGAVDTPTQGGTASGNNYRNHGWVLTPFPNKIPEDGSTINVFVNGVNLGNPVYNVYRSDIASLLHGYANNDGAGAYFDFDTTLYNNGVHIVQWTAVDNAGNAEGIGSRYFSIWNTEGSSSTGSTESGCTSLWSPGVFSKIPVNYSEPVKIEKGYGKDFQPQLIPPDEKGHLFFEIKELERIKVQLNAASETGDYVGYHIVGDRLLPLPVGSTLDREKGIFYWHAGPGFIGFYQFVFIQEKSGRWMNKKFITVKILPKFSG